MAPHSYQHLLGAMCIYIYIYGCVEPCVVRVFRILKIAQRVLSLVRDLFSEIFLVVGKLGAIPHRASQGPTHCL